MHPTGIQHLVVEVSGQVVACDLLDSFVCLPISQCGGLVTSGGTVRFHPATAFSNNPPAYGLSRRACPLSMGGKCVMNA